MYVHIKTEKLPKIKKNHSSKSTVQIRNKILTNVAELKSKHKSNL